MKNQKKGNLQGHYPFEKVALDIAGPMKLTKSGNRYILGMIDHFSKYPVLIPLKSTDSDTIIEAVFRRWISVFGIPETLHSDRGANLNSEKIKKLCDNLGIRKTKTTPYFPQGDGVVERLFRTIKPLIGIVTADRQMDWDQSIPFVEMGLRNKKSASTGFSPNEMLFGQNIQSVDIGVLKHKAKNYSYAFSYVDRVIQNISEIHGKVCKEFVVGNDIKSTIKEGDLVWVRNIRAKCGNVLFDGLYRILKNIGINAFRLKNKEGHVIDRNVIHLKACKEAEDLESEDLTSVQSVITKKEKDETDMPTLPTCIEIEPELPDDLDKRIRRYPLRKRNKPQRFGFSS